MVDIEARLRAWLATKTDFPWYGDAPAEFPEKFGTLERTGGGVNDIVIDSPTVALQVWAKSRSEAKTAAYMVVETLPSFAYEDGIRKVEINSVYNYPDDDRNHARYQIVAHFKTV